jgi:hypothetical protein
MTAWTAALASMVESPKVATISLSRNERDRQFSLFREFSPPGSLFDCRWVSLSAC